MLKYYIEPTFGQLSGVATSSPFTGNSSTPIGGQTLALQGITGAHFCFNQGEYYVSALAYTTNQTIAYYDDPTDTWKTKSESAFEQITCDDGLYATSSASVSLASSTIMLDNSSGLNYQESLFLFGVLLFFISFQTWSRISFKREDNTKS